MASRITGWQWIIYLLRAKVVIPLEGLQLQDDTAIYKIKHDADYKSMILF